MQVIGRLVLFVAAVTFFYAWFVTKIPQSESLPPEEIKLDPETLTCAQVVEAGRKTLTSKGQCLVCHSIEPDPKARGPAFSGVGARAAKRRPGLTAPEYIYQSMTQPQAFVVEGYPPIMPPANKPPADLNEFEVSAVVDYLLSLGGSPTCELDRLKELLRAAAREAPKPAVDMASLSPADRGREIFLGKGTCMACHITPHNPNPQAIVGPDLSKVGSRRDADFIRKSILDPNADVTEGYPPGVMPPIFASLLTPEELNDVVAYLSSLR
ncbi:MAG: c-type cytochrome [Nitrospirae bacterium]|nr:c-type cytochrome [Nitrospirota bacterium]